MEHAFLDQVTTAGAKALATMGTAGLNVVPVSVATRDGGDIILYDFFMQKSVENIKGNGVVALSVWDGLSGIQLKGTAVYENDSAFFHEAVPQMLARFPDRVLHGVIRCTFTSVYSISAGGDAGKLLK